MKLKKYPTSGLGTGASLEPEKEKILCGRTELEVLDQSPVGLIKINRDG